MSRHHSQTLGLKRPKFGMWSPSNQVSIINCMWVWFCHGHAHRKLFRYQKQIKGLTRLKFGMWFPRNQVSIIKHVGLVMATPIGCHFGIQILIYGSIILRLDIWTLSNHASIINHILGWKWVWFDLATPIGFSPFFFMPKAN